MVRAVPFAAALLALLAFTLATSETGAAARLERHAFFDALVARPDHWKSWSLRDPAQLDHPVNGGFAVSNNTTTGLWVTYDPPGDTDPRAQDAAKVVVPAFSAATSLAEPIAAQATTLTLVSAGAGRIGAYFEGRTLLVDREVMTVVSRRGDDITVTRGDMGTVAAAHAAGADVSLSNNSLRNQVRLPLDTSDGHSYVITWEGYWTDSYLGANLTNHKAFQFSSGGDALWLEVRTRFDGGSRCCEPQGLFNRITDVAAADMRSYMKLGGGSDWSETDGNTMGPGVTSREPLQPKSGYFVIRPNTWTRFWVRIDQRKDDYDYMDYWIADEHTDPVQLYRRVPISVRNGRGKPNTIEKFWLEFNTSTDRHVRGDMRDLVAYVRNIVVLRDVQQIDSVLIRPTPGGVRSSGPSQAR